MTQKTQIASEFLTVDEAAAILHVSRSTVYDLIRANAFPSVQLSKRARRILRAEFEAYVRRLKATTSTLSAAV